MERQEHTEVISESPAIETRTAVEHQTSHVTLDDDTELSDRNLQALKAARRKYDAIRAGRKLK